jgi:hypothetical protein
LTLVGSEYVYDFAVDDSNAYVATANGVYRVPRTGGPWAHVAGAADSDAVTIAIDATDVYWQGSLLSAPDSNGKQGTIAALLSAPLGGGPSTTLFSGFSGFYASIGLAVDATRVYGASNSSVASISIDGGAPSTLYDVTTDDVLGFAVSDAYVYVATREIGTDGPVPDGGTILRIPNGGGAPVSLIKGQSQPASIAVDDTGIYWVNGETSSPSALVRASLDGSSVTTLLTGAVGTGPVIDNVALGTNDVFWSEDELGRIMKMPKSGGEAVVVASGFHIPGKVGVQGGNVYWFCQPYESGETKAGDGLDASTAGLVTACQ